MSVNKSDNHQERIKQAEKILEQPDDYKVCEGCGSIVTVRTVNCPSCHAYCFDESAESVKKQARHLAKREAHSVLSTDLA